MKLEFRVSLNLAATKYIGIIWSYIGKAADLIKLSTFLQKMNLKFRVSLNSPVTNYIDIT